MKPLLITLFLGFVGQCFAQTSDTIQYKAVAGENLYLEIIYPAGIDTIQANLPTALFFFGGGWRSGNRSHFARQAKHLVKRGMIAVLADYRTFKSHATTPLPRLRTQSLQYAGYEQMEPI